MQTIINGMPRIAVALFIILVGVAIYRKITRTEFSEIKSCLDGFVAAAMRELKFKGGRAERSNVILTATITLAFVLLCLEDMLSRLGSILAGAPEGGSGIFVVFVVLFLFFLVSVCYMYASERYRNFTGGKQ